MNAYASITWGRIKQGRLIPLVVSYDEPIIIESRQVVRRNLQASTEASEVTKVSLPVVTAMADAPPLAPIPIPKKAASSVATSRAERIERIRQVHQRMKRFGLIPERGLVEEFAR